jgi:hypothetical protein
MLRVDALDPLRRRDETDQVTDRAPASFTFAIAATLEFPVASIGSRTIASRSARSAGSFT